MTNQCLNPYLWYLGIAGELAGVSDGGKYVGLLNTAIVLPQLCVCLFSGLLHSTSSRTPNPNPSPCALPLTGFFIEYSDGSFRNLFLLGGVVSLCAVLITMGPLSNAHLATKLDK